MPQLVTIQITRDDTGKLLTATKSIGDNLHEALEEIGDMLLRSAQTAMNEEGPGWARHAPSTIARYGRIGGAVAKGIKKAGGIVLAQDWPLLHRAPSRRGAPEMPLSNIRLNYGREVVRLGKSFELYITHLTDHARDMFFIHNRPKGERLGSNIPGRPYFRWRTGHYADSEERKAIRIFNKYLNDKLSKNGIRASFPFTQTPFFEVENPLGLNF